MRFPFATASLSLLILAAYFLSTGSALYPAQADLAFFGFQASNPLGLALHLFYHAGLNHLLGNLVPLIIFSFFLESALSSRDVFAIFLISGIAAALIFSFLNPSSILVGSSAAVSGVMAAALLLEPKKVLPFVFAVPLLVSFLVFPLVSFSANAYLGSAESSRQQLQQDVAVLVSENRLAEAASANQTLVSVTRTLSQAQEGRQREAAAPADVVAHAVGAFTAVEFLFVFQRKKLFKGLRETYLFLARLKRKI